MSEEDFNAMVELASEMKWRDAAQYIRAETTCSLLEAGSIVANRVVVDFPDSVCAASMPRSSGPRTQGEG